MSAAATISSMTHTKASPSESSDPDGSKRVSFSDQNTSPDVAVIAPPIAVADTPADTATVAVAVTTEYIVPAAHTDDSLSSSSNPYSADRCTNDSGITDSGK